VESVLQVPVKPASCTWTSKNPRYKQTTRSAPDCGSISELVVGITNPKMDVADVVNEVPFALQQALEGIR